MGVYKRGEVWWYKFPSLRGTGNPRVCSHGFKDGCQRSRARTMAAARRCSQWNCQACASGALSDWRRSLARIALGRTQANHPRVITASMPASSTSASATG
jgi:hypothetical protein